MIKLNIQQFGGRGASSSLSGGASSSRIPYTRETFKNYIENELKDLEPYISKIRKSKENRMGQFGIYITGNETISPTTNRFYTYETYIPFEENMGYLKSFIDTTREELKTLSRKNNRRK